MILAESAVLKLAGPQLLHLGIGVSLIMWLIRLWLALRFRRSIMRGMSRLSARRLPRDL